MDGIELHRRLVEAGWKLPVILISGYLTVRATAGAMEQGVFRVLEKPYRNDELAIAIQDAIEHDLARREQKWYRLDLEHRLESLDGRERQTLDLILAGHPNKAIERRLGLSRRTVERVRSSILAKTNFLSFVELSAAYGETRAAKARTHAAQPQKRDALHNPPLSPPQPPRCHKTAASRMKETGDCSAVIFTTEPLSTCRRPCCDCRRWKPSTRYLRKRDRIAHGRGTS